MRYAADAMLGRLAKWLRLMGFDVLYHPDIEDRQLIRIAREQERTILTRDTRLLKSKGITNPIFIHSDDIFGQLSELRGIVDFGSADPMGRCEGCNGSLSKVTEKEEIRDVVPDYVYHNFSSFSRCNECGKVYWEGSHYKSIRNTIEAVLRGQAEPARGGGSI